MKVFIGYDSTQIEAWRVATMSLMKTSEILPEKLSLDDLRGSGEYRRPTERRDGQLWDVISEHSMSTEFAISRFFTPIKAGKSGWALFTDCDVLFRADVHELMDIADPKYAVMCVKHKQITNSDHKKDGRENLRYACKNWSSVMLFNCAHPANNRLTVNLINAIPGRELHRFCWLDDNEIGSLGIKWNWLVGHSPNNIDAKIAHFTEGLPTSPGCENDRYADEWSEYYAKSKKPSGVVERDRTLRA